MGLLQPGPLQNLVLIPVFRKASAPHLWNGGDNDNSDPRRLNDTTHTLAEALAHAGSQWVPTLIPLLDNLVVLNPG